MLAVDLMAAVPPRQDFGSGHDADVTRPEDIAPQDMQETARTRMGLPDFSARPPARWVPWQPPTKAEARAVDDAVTRLLAASGPHSLDRAKLEAGGTACIYFSARLAVVLAAVGATRACAAQAADEARIGALRHLEDDARRLRLNLRAFLDGRTDTKRRAPATIGTLVNWSGRSAMPNDLTHGNAEARTVIRAQRRIARAVAALAQVADVAQRELARINPPGRGTREWLVQFVLGLGSRWMEWTGEPPSPGHASRFVQLAKAGYHDLGGPAFNGNEWPNAVEAALRRDAEAPPWQRMDRYATGAERPGWVGLGDTAEIAAARREAAALTERAGLLRDINAARADLGLPPLLDLPEADTPSLH